MAIDKPIRGWVVFVTKQDASIGSFSVGYWSYFEKQDEAIDAVKNYLHLPDLEQIKDAAEVGEATFDKLGFLPGQVCAL